MTSLLMRTGSLPVQTRFTPSRKVTPAISRHNSVESLPSHGGDRFPVVKIAIDVKAATVGLRRVSSESDVIRAERMSKSVGSKPSPAKIPEDDEAEEEDGIRFSDGWGSLILKQGVSRDGGGSGYSGGGGDGGGGYGDRRKIGDYYREMLKSNPNNSLLLMNYGKFLYEVWIVCRWRKMQREQRSTTGERYLRVQVMVKHCQCMGS
ncbi:Uncharacterized protein HA466_0136410 [Hirschfeldia incana]|nr:Uncharacterized protein HA466_0136410 [Hirschfeldia incana]